MRIARVLALGCIALAVACGAGAASSAPVVVIEAAPPAADAPAPVPTSSASAKPAPDAEDDARPRLDENLEQPPSLRAPGLDAGATTAGPRGDVRIGASTATVPVPSADRVVAGLRPRLRRCYDGALVSDPGIAGAVILTFTIGRNGEVSTAALRPNNVLPASMESCVVGVLKKAGFDPPGAKGSTITVPVTFVKPP